MKITETLSGRLSQESIKNYNLINDNNVTVSILTYGGTITGIKLPDKGAGLRYITPTFQNWEDYIKNPLYPGSNLGPNAGRIKNGEMTIGNTPFQLSKNDGNHNLHGGFFSISYGNWILKELKQKKDTVSVTLGISLADGQDGYPGNRQIQASYTLDNSNRLTIEYRADTDQDTYFNLSNHTYFNLSGNFSNSGLEQTLLIEADYYIANNQEHLPIKFCPVDNSPFDFRKPISLKKNLNAYPEHPQIKISKGYNNGFDIRKAALKNCPVLTLWDSEHTAGLRLYTDAPCLVLYSGGFIEDNYKLENGFYMSESCALALEPQDFPDAAHFAEDSAKIGKKGKCYQRRIVYEFLF